MIRQRLRDAERYLRSLAYLAVGFSGISALLWPPRTYDAYASVMTVVWGALQLLGFVAAGAVFRRRVLWEWRLLPAIIVAVSMYAALGWIQVVAEGLIHGGRTGDLTMLVLLLLARFVYLWRKVAQAEGQVRARAEQEDA